MEENNVLTPEETVQTEQTETIQSKPSSEFTYEPEPEKEPEIEKEPVKKKKTGAFKKIMTGLLSMILIPSAVGFGSGIAAYKMMDSNNDKVVLQTIQSQTVTTGTNADSSGTKVSDVAAAVKDTVVEITTESVATSSFFSNYVTTGAGSGVIFTNDGYIVTNNHVIEGANTIQVRLTNGDFYSATLIATDSRTDLAVIKIEATGLTAAILGDSDALVVGEDAIAIGNPLGELDREVSVEGRKMNLLQTNAAINPGNSGGGLFNAKGELIGIVSAKSSGTDIEGLGFAIPVNDVKEVVVQLIEKGYVAGRPALGVSIVDINSIQLAMQYGVSQYGVYILEVLEGSAAEKAGLQSGDMFIAMNDVIIESYEDLSNALSSQAVGDTVIFQIKRNGRMIQIEVTLQENTNPNQ